jgi:3-oxoacyl-[acyl-carrier protein] reductase
VDSPRQYDNAQRRAQARGVSFEVVREEQARKTAARRFGRPEEVAAACAFLCSEQAGYTTGLEFRVDGGGILGNGAEWEIDELSTATGA